MRAISRLFALVVPMTVITTAPVPSTAAASAKDTCSLLTQTQLTDAVGTSMNAGTYMMPEIRVYLYISPGQRGDTAIRV
jgi:hypothetical protein